MEREQQAMLVSGTDRSSMAVDVVTDIDNYGTINVVK